MLFLALYSITLNEAERRVDAGTAAMFINTGPILITVLAGIFLKEGFPRRLFAGCAVAFAGCVLIGLAGSRSGSTGGIALLAVAAVAYASAVVIQKPVLGRVSPLSVTWVGCACATLVCLPFAPTLVTAAKIRTGVELGAGVRRPDREALALEVGEGLDAGFLAGDDLDVVRVDGGYAAQFVELALESRPRCCRRRRA